MGNAGVVLGRRIKARRIHINGEPQLPQATFGVKDYNAGFVRESDGINGNVYFGFHFILLSEINYLTALGGPKRIGVGLDTCLLLRRNTVRLNVRNLHHGLKRSGLAAEEIKFLLGGRKVIDAKIRIPGNHVVDGRMIE